MTRHEASTVIAVGGAIVHTTRASYAKEVDHETEAKRGTEVNQPRRRNRAKEVCQAKVVVEGDEVCQAKEVVLGNESTIRLVQRRNEIDHDQERARARGVNPEKSQHPRVRILNP